MSKYTDFFPRQTLADKLPGVVLGTSREYNADGVNFLDITDDVIVDTTIYPDLAANLVVSDWDNISIQKEITNPNAPGNSDNIGIHNVLYKDTLAVAHPYSETGLSGSGMVYIYKRTGTSWGLEQTIDNQLGSNDAFGTSCDIYEDTIAIGGPGMEVSAVTSAGKVEVWTRSGTTWTLEQSIPNPDPVTNTYYGHSVSLHGDTLIVGCPSDTSETGVAYVYTRSGTTWTLEQEIVNPGDSGDQFGYSVALYEDTAVITGRHYHANDYGRVYVYTRSGTTWTLEQTIDNPSPSVADYFGDEISLHKDTLALGSSTDGPDGLVYLYTRSAGVWSLEKLFDPADYTTSGNTFGFDISLYGNTLLIGDYNTTDGGALYIFERTGTSWELIQRLTTPGDTTTQEQFGKGCTLYENNFAVATPGEDGTYLAEGVVWVYTQDTGSSFRINDSNKVLKLT